MSVKLSDLRLLYGIAGAQEKFEDLVSKLVHSEHPGSDRVRVVTGDEGIDSFTGELTDPNGIDVFQVKAFFEKIGDSQKTQIRGSFASVKDSDKVKAKSWTLCLPIDMGVDERKWFETWAEKQKATGIEIRPVWGANHIESLLLTERHKNLREVFFRQEHLQILQEQSETLEKLLQEFTGRVPVPSPEKLSVTFRCLQPTNAYAWAEDKMVIGMHLVYDVTNVGSKSVPHWKFGARIDSFDPELQKRLVDANTFPQLARKGIPISTPILPTLSETAWQPIGVMVRRSEPFGETLRKTLESLRIICWGISDGPPGEETSFSLADHIDWATLHPSFEQSYILALGRADAIM